MSARGAEAVASMAMALALANEDAQAIGAIARGMSPEGLRLARRALRQERRMLEAFVASAEEVVSALERAAAEDVPAIRRARFDAFHRASRRYGVRLGRASIALGRAGEAAAFFEKKVAL